MSVSYLLEGSGICVEEGMGRLQDPKIMNYFKEITFADINKANANVNS